MKKIIGALLLFLSISFCKAQQYTQFELFDSTLSSGYFELTDCSDNFQSNIILDPALYTYVTGMKFYVVIDSVQFTGPISMAPVHAGDTTFLDASDPEFSIFAISGLQVWYRLRLSGTPTVAGQIYPCAIELNMCTCICTNTHIQPSASALPECVVDLFNSVAETDLKPVTAYPVPASTSVVLQNNKGRSGIDIYNVYGQLVLKTAVYNEDAIDISALADGMYSLYIVAENNKPFYSKISVTR